MEWNTKQTIHVTNGMKNQLNLIEEYLKKQAYFTNESIKKVE